MRGEAALAVSWSPPRAGGKRLRPVSGRSGNLGRRPVSSAPQQTLGTALRAARSSCGLTLREVAEETGIQRGHLSQIENGIIAKPEMALLWDLAVLYGAPFHELLALAGYARGEEPSRYRRQRMTVALRALEELSPRDQIAALEYMAELRRRHAPG
jgi:transcriptional regulator with XRE-family HTH domain